MATVDEGLRLMVELADHRVDLDGIAAFLVEHSGIRDDATGSDVDKSSSPIRLGTLDLTGEIE